MSTEEISPEKMRTLLDELAALDLDYLEEGEEPALGWTEPDAGVPDSGILPLEIAGVTEYVLNSFIRESPDIRATRVQVGDGWLQIYAGTHPAHGEFTILMEENDHLKVSRHGLYLIQGGRLLGSNPIYWCGHERLSDDSNTLLTGG